uniref:WW domain-containing protein n=1 Tax=Hemiselmis tepida TaxID=464990 RepID=A0A7S0W6I1_9CRYP
MPLSFTKIACATAAAGALVGHASAFAVSPNAPAFRVGGSPALANALPSSAQRARHGDALSLRASSNKPGKESFAIEIDKDSMTVDPSGNTQVETQGAYLDDGWTDPEATSGGGGGWFAGLFQQKPTKSLYGNAPKKSAAQLNKDLDVIEYVDGTKGSLDQAMKAGRAVPFGGLNPSQIEVYRKAKEEKTIEMQNMAEGRYIMYPDRNPQKGGQKAPAPPVPPTMPGADLAEGWYSAYDESTQSEYYYNDEGATTWERPVGRK